MNAVSRSNLRESVWCILFYVGMFYSVVFSLSQHICIFYSVVVGLSLYCLFLRCILFFIHCPQNGGGGILENNLLLNKNLLEACILTLIILSFFVSLFF